MRFRPVLTALAVAVLAVSAAPAHADPVVEDFGTPIVDERYNDGEVGYVKLAFGPNGTARSTSHDRPMGADCQFVIEPSVNSSAITLQIVAHSVATPYRNANGTPIVPSATGVTCTVTLGNGVTRTATAAISGAAGVAHGRWTIPNFASPVTVCSKPNALWSDNVHQIASTSYCKTS